MPTMRKAIVLLTVLSCASAFAPSSPVSLDRSRTSARAARASSFQHRLFVFQQERQEQDTNKATNVESSSSSASWDYNENVVTTAAPSADDNNTWLWRGVVVALCAIWASNFAVIKLVVAEPGVDSSVYAVARFGLATATLIPFALPKITGKESQPQQQPEETAASGAEAAPSLMSGMDAETLKGSIVCGSWVAFGYIGQLLGLLTTTASKSCVICSLHCVFVAAVAELWRTQEREKSYDFKVLVPAALAVAGVSIVELWGASSGANVGDLLSVAQPIGFGMGYLKLESLMAKRPDLAVPVSTIKLAMVTLASLFYFEIGPLLSDGAADWAPRLPDFGPILASSMALGGVVYTGLVTTAIALWVESVAFARVPATDASLILTTEPLFAAALGAVALGETFGGSDYLGATCIIGACVLATLMGESDEDCTPADGQMGGKEEICEPKRRWPFWGF